MNTPITNQQPAVLRGALRSIVLLAVLTLYGTTSSMATETPIDGIVAVVEEAVILQSELDEAKRAILGQLAQQSPQLPPDDVINKQVLERLIITKLQVLRAQETGIRISDEEVQGAVTRVAKGNGLTVNQMRQSLASDGLDFGVFWEELRSEMAIRRLKQRIARSRVTVSETEVDIYLSANEGNQGEFRLGHILLSISAAAAPEELEAKTEELERIYSELRAGADFAQMAVTYSNGQKALEGGDLGWRAADQLPAALASAVRDLKIGELAEPVRSQSGFHILKVVDYRTSTQHMVDEIQASHILVKISELVSAEQAIETITDIKQQLDNGEAFEDLAKRLSEDTATSAAGGDMGWQPVEAFGGRVQSVLSDLNLGEVSVPFQTAAGWHVARLDGRRESDRTEEFIRNQAREAIRTQKSEAEVETFIRRLRDEAYIEYKIDV